VDSVGWNVSRGLLLEMTGFQQGARDTALMTGHNSLLSPKHVSGNYLQSQVLPVDPPE